MAVFENSRYLHTTLSNRLGWEVPTLDIRERFVFNEADCSVHTWVEGDTLDGVAYKFYNNTALRWVIIDANPKYRTEFEIEKGDTLLIPKYEEVVNLINANIL